MPMPFSIRTMELSVVLNYYGYFLVYYGVIVRGKF
jgi:hypothetical protein